MTAEVIELRPPATFAEQQPAVQLLLNLEAAGAVTVTSLELSDTEMPFERYEKLGAFLGFMKKWTSWAIGDWLNFGEGVYGHEFAQAAAATGLTEQTLLQYQFVCRNVPQSRRHVQLSFGTHALVARMEPKEQNYWLRQAVKKGWGERELREAMKAKRTEMAPEMFPDTKPQGELAEVALAILRDARAADDGQHWLVPNEDIARLKAAVGHEED
jgi:hypothetical protein